MMAARDRSATLAPPGPLLRGRQAHRVDHRILQVEAQQVGTFRQVAQRLPPHCDMVQRVTAQRQGVIPGEPAQASPLPVEDRHAYATGRSIGIHHNGIARCQIDGTQSNLPDAVDDAAPGGIGPAWLSRRQCECSFTDGIAQGVGTAASAVVPPLTAAWTPRL